MKTCSKVISCCLLAVLLLTQIISAASVSPALSILAARSTMVKTGNTYTGVLFSQDDFLNSMSFSKLRSITITSLPPVSEGTLYLGNIPVSVNQTISKDALNNLKFIPQDGITSSSFFYTTDRDYSIRCDLLITDEINFAPTVASGENTVMAWTQKDISCYGSLDAYDPENDALVYEIVDYPEKGLLILTNVTHGDFKYTPYVGCSGNDSFTYRVRDSFGNYSETAKAMVKISRKNSKIVFADMEDHWAHSAAIEMADAGIMEYETNGDQMTFQPEETVSREDFLVMVMRTLGAKKLSGGSQTVFADDNAISADTRPYVCAAYNAGIIQGSDVDGMLCFCPQDPITRAEAAVIMNNIIGAEVPVHVSLFTDNNSIPTWAQSALYALNDLKILCGTGSGSMDPMACITKAQAAQILFNLQNYINS